MNKDNIQIDLRKEFEKEYDLKLTADDYSAEGLTYIYRLEDRISLQADRIKELEEKDVELNQAYDAGFYACDSQAVEKVKQLEEIVRRTKGDLSVTVSEKQKLEAEKKELEDDKKKLVEDWEELDSDCMILHDKNKQLKKENKELKEKLIEEEHGYKNVEKMLKTTEKEKAEIIDKVCEIIKKMPIFFENEFSEWLEELINQIRKV
jgi:chromosome segregation ATPase